MNLRIVYLLRNLTRNPLRTALTCAAVALPIIIFVLSAAVVDGFDRYLDNSVRQLRLAVTHKASIVHYLPSSYRRKIEALDPERKQLVSVCGMRWIGGAIENDTRPLSTLAVDMDTFFDTFPEYRDSPEIVAAWNRDRQALIVGRGTAAQHGWTVGSRVTMRPSLPPYSPMEFHVISTAENAEDAITMWCRGDYLEEELKKAEYPVGHIGFLFIKCSSKPALDHMQQAIDQHFAGATEPTKTQDEKAFMNEFVTQQFNLPRNLRILAAVTVFVAVMAAANTMSMNFRDRLNEFATFKSLGFGRGYTVSIIQAESMTLCTLGGVIGAFVPWFMFTVWPFRGLTVPLIQHLDVHPLVCAQSLVISLAIGLIAGAWPAWLAMRMHVVNALRNLE